MGQKLIMKWLTNIGQISDQEGKTWEMESAIATLQRELVNPEEGEYLLSKSFPIMNPEDTLRIQNHSPQRAEVYTKEMILMNTDFCILP